MPDARAEFERWLASPALSGDERAELAAIRDDAPEIESRFFAPLEFGTAGLRGMMGTGLGRMNVHVVRWVTQAFAEVILQARGADGVRVAICRDSRHNSKLFAEETASVLAGNGITALMFDDIRPTPELSFAVREYGCAAGVNITASHNTREYNGYKVYGANGAQLSPRDADAVAAIMRARCVFDSVRRLDYADAAARGLITTLGAETDEAFLTHVLTLARMGAETDVAARDLRIAYTPFHGAGYRLVPLTLARLGFTNVSPVAAQMTPDGDFPTVASPNPEVPESFRLAAEHARAVGADIILGTDPDCDRIAVLAKHNDEYVHISGNKTGALLLDYIIGAYARAGAMPENPAALKTIVTTELARVVAEAHGVACIDTFTGFKFMAEKKDELESAGAARVIFAYEESYGYMAGDFTRDKDAVTAAALIAEMAAWYFTRGMTLADALERLYVRYGYYAETTVNLVMPGVDGFFRMKSLMDALRAAPPEELAGVRVVSRRDYLTGLEYTPGGETTLVLSGSNVLRFDTEDGTAVLVRPSGTEPKIKVYLLARGGSASEGEALLAKYARWAASLAEAHSP